MTSVQVAPGEGADGSVPTETGVAQTLPTPEPAEDRLAEPGAPRPRATLEDRVAAARRRNFVGRATEIAAFEALLADPEPHSAVLVIHGPAGIGKSTLLRRLASVCAETHIPHVLVDARDLAPVPEAVQARLDAAVTGLDREPTTGIGLVVLLDTYELLAACDDRLRSEVFPALPADTLLVLAGQNGPSPGWLSDPGWSELLLTMRLANLSVAESRAYLTARGIADSLQASALEFTHGHPLALALVCEVLRQRGQFSARASVDVVTVLVQALLTTTPSATHRRALEVAAEVRVLTQPLLAAALEQHEVSDVFDWLLTQPFVDAGPTGLHLHDLARRVLSADLRWRDPQRYREVHARTRAYYLAQLDQPAQAAPASVLLDLMYLHEDLRRFLRPADDAAGGARMRGASAGDAGPVAEMVARHEGAESATLAGYWWVRQPDAWQVVVDDADRPVGCVCLISLAETSDDDAARDPAIRSARQELARHPPLRPGERATLVRFWLAGPTYQSVSEIQSAIAVALARHYLATPGLAITLLPFANPQEWADFCAYADQQRLPMADFSIGGRDYAVFGHDWRIVTPAAWVELLSRREIGEALERPRPGPGNGLLVLGEAEFATAVRAALRGLTRPGQLRANPLLRSRMVQEQAASPAVTDQVAALQALIREAASTLRSSPADERLYRVVHRAYLAPAPSLERAAEAVGLPSSTFRRLLTTAVQRVTSLLWHRELES